MREDHRSPGDVGAIRRAEALVDQATGIGARAGHQPDLRDLAQTVRDLSALVAEVLAVTPQQTPPLSELPVVMDPGRSRSAHPVSAEQALCEVASIAKELEIVQYAIWTRFASLHDACKDASIEKTEELRDAILEAGRVIRRIRIAVQRGGAGTKTLPPDVIDLAAQRLKRDSE